MRIEKEIKRREEKRQMCGVVWCLIQDPAQESGNNEEKMIKDRTRAVMPSFFLPCISAAAAAAAAAISYR